MENFFYERNTGYTSEDFEEETHDAAEAEHGHGADLPVYLFEQADATLYGLEAQLAWQLSPAVNLTLWGDSIRGKLDDGGKLPRIPPKRLGSQLRYQNNGWEAEIDISHYFKQNQLAELETSTEAYTLVDAELAYTFTDRRGELTAYLKGSNLTDEEARVHSSFLKDRAPLPGRGFSIGLRGRF